MATRPRLARDFTNARLKTLLGSTAIDHLTDTTDAPLRIGTRRWSRHQLATQLGVINARAARLLTVAAEHIGATSVRELYQKSSPYTFALHGIGEMTLYVLWRLFEAEGLDVDTWAQAGKADEALVSFRSLKHREQQAEQRTHDAERKRTGRSRTQHRDAVAADKARR